MTDETQQPEKKKGMGTGPKIAIGCGIVALVGIIIVVVALISGGLFLSKKAKEAGLDAELLRKNPAVAAAKVAVAANPELELVEVDENARTVTIRNKETGETLTADFEDIEKGRISFKTEEGEMTIQTDESGARAEIKDEEGETQTVEFGASPDKSKIPGWIPLYEGELTAVYTTSAGESRTGSFSIETGAGVEEVRDFYVPRLEDQGLSVKTSSFETAGTRMINLSASDENNKREITVHIQQEEEGKTTIAIQYRMKP